MSYRINLNDGTWHTSALLSISRVERRRFTLSVFLSFSSNSNDDDDDDDDNDDDNEDIFVAVRAILSLLDITKIIFLSGTAYLDTFYFDLLIDVYEY